MHLEDKMKRIFEAYPFGFMQDFATLVTLLRSQLIEVDQFVAFIWEKKRKAGAKATKEVKQFCPLCTAPMRLMAININKATQTGDDLKSVWLCVNRECMNTIYNKESIKELCSKGGK